MEKILDKLIKWDLYLLTFLTPLFFLPFTLWPVSQNKQLLFSILVFLGLLFWVAKIIIEGRFTFVWSKPVLAVLIWLSAFLLSTLFSISRSQSFWGANQEPDVYFNFLLWGVCFFLFVNFLAALRQTREGGETQSPRESFLVNVSRALLFSTGLMSLVFLVQIFSRSSLFSWSFANFPSFNSIGTAQGFAVLLGGAFILLMAFFAEKKSAFSDFGFKPKALNKILPYVLGILLLAAIFSVNYWVVWLGLAFGLVIILAEMSKHLALPGQQVSFRRLLLPMFLLILALVLIFVRQSFFNGLVPPEIGVTYKTTLATGWKTFQESAKNWILGSGPGTFGYKFSLYRSPALNLTDFWQMRFSQGIAVLPTFLLTAGFLGLLSMLFLIAVFFWQGFRKLLAKNEGENAGDFSRHLEIGFFAAGFYFLILWFFYPINFTLGFSAFLMLALWQGSALKQKEKKEFLFTKSPQQAFFIMLFCILFVAFSALALYDTCEKYRAALIFSQGINLTAGDQPKIDEAIEKIAKAAQIDNKDLYYRNLSQLYLAKINAIGADEKMPSEEKQNLLQAGIALAESSAASAVKANQNNSQNWLQAAIIYENLYIAGIDKAAELALTSYEKAASLDPQNPQIALNIGRVYKELAEKNTVELAMLENSKDKDESLIQQKKEEQESNFDLALANLNKSAELKPDFSAAYYLMAQLFETKGDKTEALKNYKIVLQLEPKNEEVKKKVNELSR